MEAGGLVEEVDSEGEGITPSAWNQSNFLGKEEDVTMETLEKKDQSWAPVINEILFMRVLKSIQSKRLLLKLILSHVTNAESLDALYGLVEKI